MTAGGDLIIDPPINYHDNAQYKFNFFGSSKAPKDGFIDITFPPDVVFDSEEMLKVGICDEDPPICEFKQGDDRTIRIRLTEDLNKNVGKDITLGGVKNARSFKPTGTFSIATYDSEGNYIDEGYNRNVATTEAGVIELEEIQRESTVNGEVNTYTFSLTTSVPWVNGDVLKFTFPPEISLNADNKQTKITPLNDGDQIDGGISGNDIQITFVNMAERPDTYKFEFTMDNVKNAGSIKPSGGFTGMRIITNENFLVA